VQDYLQIKKQADQRDTWLGQLIEAQAAATGTSKKSQWKKIQQTEAIRKKAFNVKRALGQLETRRGLIQVSAPTEEANPTRITHMNKEKIELACLNEAHRQFTQAAEMPMLQEPMFSRLGLADIESEAFQQILDGTFKCPKQCDSITQRLLQQLAHPPGVQDHSPRSYEEYQWGWTRARDKSTALSPSGIHFGHYMVAMADVTVAKLNAILANLALRSGTAPK